MPGCVQSVMPEPNTGEEDCFALFDRIIRFGEGCVRTDTSDIGLVFKQLEKIVSRFLTSSSGPFIVFSANPLNSTYYNMYGVIMPGYVCIQYSNRLCNIGMFYAHPLFREKMEKCIANQECKYTVYDVSQSKDDFVILIPDKALGRIERELLLRASVPATYMGSIRIFAVTPSALSNLHEQVIHFRNYEKPGYYIPVFQAAVLKGDNAIPAKLIIIDAPYIVVERQGAKYAIAA